MWAYIFPAHVPRLHANYTFIASYRFDVFNWLKLFWVFQLFLKLFWFFNCLKLIWTFLNDQSCLNSLFCELTCPCCVVGMPTAAASCTVAHWTPAHRVTSRGHVDSIRLLWSWPRSQWRWWWWWWWSWYLFSGGSARSLIAALLAALFSLSHVPWAAIGIWVASSLLSVAVATLRRIWTSERITCGSPVPQHWKWFDAQCIYIYIYCVRRAC